MVEINPTMSVTTLNVSGLNAPIQRQKLSKWIQKQAPTLCDVQETHFEYKDT